MVARVAPKEGTTALFVARVAPMDTGSAPTVLPMAPFALRAALLVLRASTSFSATAPLWRHLPPGATRLASSMLSEAPFEAPSTPAVQHVALFPPSMAPIVRYVTP